MLNKRIEEIAAKEERARDELNQSVRSFEDFGRDDIHADLPRVRVPQLLMTAENGGVVGDDDVAEWQGLAPDTLHRRVPAAGHMIPWDNEAGFHEALGDFLEPRS